MGAGATGEAGPLAERAVVALGEAMLRLTAPVGLRLRSARSFASHVAGAEANVAVALAYLGVPVRWISALPANPLGDHVASELAGAGVDLRFVERPADGRLGLFFVEQGAGRRSTRVWYDRADSAFARTDRFDPAALQDAAYAVVSGITPALGSAARRLTGAFVARAHEVGAQVCVDVNYRAMLWSPQDAQRELAGLVASADIVVCSRRDARLVFGVDGAAGEAALAFVAAWAPGARVVVITDGERGSVLVAQGALIEQPAFPTTVVDRFGAGDAFLAGLLWGLRRGDEPAQALRSAAMLASLKCTIAGDLARFSEPDLTSALRAAPEGVIVR
jgi:2-dehydro-3-deoxygluconokinase